jgi:colanic acid/amylovoran biosynthesis glycosyltransferase
MRIGLVIPSTPSYSETFFTSKIKGLKNSGFTVILFTQIISPDFSLCPVVKSPRVKGNKFLFFASVLKTVLTLLPHLKSVIRYYKLLKKSDNSTLNILKRIYLNSHILKYKLDWLHFGFTTQAIGSELVAKAIGAKMAVSFRGFDINVYPKKYKNCYTKVWTNVDKVHSISKYLVDEAYGLGLNKSVPTSIIPPAINLETITAINENQYKNTSKPFTICTVARLNWIKDISTALKTIQILKKTYPDIVYKIIGTGSTKEKERYLLLTKELDLKDNVIFCNKLEHAQTLQVVSECDIYLQTSLNEGFCNAVLEAQAIGKLCVATNVGGLPENIVDKKTGWLVEAENPNAIATKIQEVTKLTDGEKLEIATYAKERAKSQFNLKNQAFDFERFYTN